MRNLPGENPWHMYFKKYDEQEQDKPIVSHKSTHQSFFLSKRCDAQFSRIVITFFALNLHNKCVFHVHNQKCKLGIALAKSILLKVHTTGFKPIDKC